MPSPFLARDPGRAFDRLRSRIVGREGAPTAAVVAPFTGQPITALPRVGVEAVDEAVRRARAAQPAWEALGVRARCRILARFGELVLRRSEEALDLIQLEGGKARINAHDEVLDVALVASHYAHKAHRYLAPRRRVGALPLLTRTVELRHPVGVVGVISPWNFPLNLPIGDALPALAAGNTVVVRPDEQTSFIVLWAAALLEEAGLPPDVLLVVTGDGPTLGPALVDRVDFIMFTGSTRTGTSVAERAAARLIGVSLELGGKNPMIVLEDADVDAAVAGIAHGAFAGAGQVCVSIERCYVHRAVLAEFQRKLVERVHRPRIGGAFDFSCDVGSLANARQLATVESHVQDALARGATLLAGGRARPDLGPFFYEPTVLAGVHEGMLACRDETFGPVIALHPFVSDDEAIALANDSEFGLNASVWSRSRRHAFAVAQRIRSGMVNVNDVYLAGWSSTASPIGGMKKSGLGRRHGAEGIRKYTEVQTIAIQRGLPLTPRPQGTHARYARTLALLTRLKARIPGLR